MKDPAFLFYSADFITGTILMTDDQIGKYIKLLCLQHQKGHLSEKHMLNICKTYDKDIFEKFNRDEAGLFFNKRLDDEVIRRSKYSESRRKNRMSEKIICKSYDEHMETITETIIKDNEDKEELLRRKGEKFREDVSVYVNKYSVSMINAFCDYWTEMNQSKTKMRFELEKVFEISKRLATWANKDKEFNKSVKSPKTYEEMLELTKNNPELWKQYKSVKKDGERKAIFIPIEI